MASKAITWCRGAVAAFVGAAAIAGCASETPSKASMSEQDGVATASDAAAPAPSTSDTGLIAVAKQKPSPEHDDARFWVDYGDRAFLVNVRYIDFMSQSVVAVREAKPSSDVDGRRRVGAAPHTTLGPELRNPADPAFEAVAVDIAETLSSIGRICADGERLETRRDDDGAAKTMYRRDRQVWVVFADCRPADETALN